MNFLKRRCPAFSGVGGHIQRLRGNPQNSGGPFVGNCSDAFSLGNVDEWESCADVGWGGSGPRKLHV